MTRSQEQRIFRGLWTLYGLLAVAGTALLAHALFVPPKPGPFTIRMPDTDAMAQLKPGSASKDGLIDKRFSRRVVGRAPSQGPAQPQAVPLDQLIKLTGILDFGGKQPTLAVIEATGETKAYKSGDKIGETGVLIKDIKDCVVVEFEKRRFKVTFAGIQELPADSVGKD